MNLIKERDGSYYFFTLFSLKDKETWHRAVSPLFPQDPSKIYCDLCPFCQTSKNGLNPTARNCR